MNLANEDGSEAAKHKYQQKNDFCQRKFGIYSKNDQTCGF
jgi:hypothetical protein